MPGQPDFKKERKHHDKVVMNEQNWHLLQNSREDIYIPNKLPFFAPPVNEPKEEGLLKLRKTQ